MIVDWVNLWAFAVAEENASGGKIVTAPTMGAAGIVPAVMRYYQRFALSKSPYEREKADIIFMATASAICSLYRANASISGAEVGCQGRGRRGLFNGRCRSDGGFGRQSQPN